jgi:VWFA-related protein
MNQLTARASLVTFAAVAMLAAPAAQQAFRGRTDLVSVYATVMDPTGRLVTDLAAADFEVRDNGKKQQVEYFNNDMQPITVVLMLDRSGSMADNFTLVEDAAEQFIRKLTDSDKARIGSFSRQVVISPADFTSSQSHLAAILRHGLQEIGPSPVWTSIDRSITALMHQDGRRVVLVFTDGHDDPGPGQVATELKDVIRRATYDEVMVYAIGLANRDDVLSPLSLHNVIGQAQLGRGTTKEKLVKPDPGLRRLAETTGGGYFQLDWSQDLGATFARVADELHRQYALAFRPARLDSEVHKLDVRVKRQGLTIRARRSYVAEAR